jgi:Asp-tRNA(Asn)/Glu-tRNA(Gln) amidotransferase A subunit family amidase
MLIRRLGFWNGALVVAGAVALIIEAELRAEGGLYAAQPDRGPAATVRGGTSAEELPIDVQLVARPWRDDVALATALRVERELGPWPPPSL